ncbi:MAG TPA: hypothetical protein VGA08_01335 [Candidatus Saccharimonadales bacterium]
MSVRKLALIDLDDTLARTQAAMLRYVNSKSVNKYYFNDLTQEHRLGRPTQYANLIRDFLGRPDLVMKVKPFKQAAAALKLLRTCGYDLELLTARKPNLRTTTGLWLNQHGLDKYFSHVHQRPEKTDGDEYKFQVAKQRRPAFLVDDTLSVAVRLQPLKHQFYLVTKPWNHTQDLPPSVTRIHSIFQLAKKLAKTA